jgi:L-iditol 2-dehydrogenase
MKALVKVAPGHWGLELRDIPVPQVQPHQIKIQVAGCGICGTDVHIVRGAWRCDPPVVLGHEWCGTVVEVGKSVAKFAVGDRVVASNPAQTCGNCFYCLAGNPFMCPDRISAGYMIDGAFAEFICIDARRAHRIADHVTFRAAALGEPIAVAVHAVLERTTVRAGDVVLVSGPGCIGLLTMLVAKLQGATVLISGLDTDQSRLDLAEKLGADHAINVQQNDPIEVVRSLTGGRGADFVFDCSGSAKSISTTWQAVKKQGTVVSVGVLPGPIETDFNQIMMKELTVIGTYGYVWTSWERTVTLLAQNRLPAAEIVSHELPLDQFQLGFDMTMDGRASKVVLNPLL